MYNLVSPCINSSPNTEVHNKTNNNSNLKAVCLYDYNASEFIIVYLVATLV